MSTVHAAALALTIAFVGPLQDTRREWGPEQALGAPDTPGAGDLETAWASETEDGRDEWLQLEFARPVVPTGVRVFETFNPGALVAVSVLDADGNEHEVWRGIDPVPRERELGIALVAFVTDVETRVITLHLASSAVAGWNEIDAVGLHAADGSLQWAIAAEASTTYAGGEAAASRHTEAPLAVPLDALDTRHATTAEDAFATFVGVKAAGGAGPELLRKLADHVERVQRGAPPPSGFEGRWATNFGLLVLRTNGDELHGTYPEGRLEGRIVRGRLEARYIDDTAAGECAFELEDGGRKLNGRWRADDSERWLRWHGRRATDAVAAPLTWLVVLEAPWQTELSEPEYSFGAMLTSIFGQTPGVAVRQRFFTDEVGFHRYCQEAGRLDGEVILSIAAHGDKDGIQARDEMIDPQAIAAALEHMPNLRLVHFSSCAVMAGATPKLVNDALVEAGALGFEGVSGYERPVDWMGSALCEFTYFELLLARGLAAADAAKLLPLLFPLAAETPPEGSPISALRFRFVPPVR